MPFKPPSWVSELTSDIPNVSIDQFVFDERHGRCAKASSKPPFVCGLTNDAPSIQDVEQQVDDLAQGIAAELGWSVNEGSEWDKVVGVYSVNTIDYLPLAWAVHRLGGIVSPANAAYTATDLEYQLRDARATCLFTCPSLLEVGLIAARAANIPAHRVFVMGSARTTHASNKTIRQLIDQGRSEPRLQALYWPEGESARRNAFLCYSSGTSGLPKGVMISHRNVIANILQITAFDRSWRDRIPTGNNGPHVENVLGVLPLSHIYGLIVIAHASVYRGDGVVVLPKFSFQKVLEVIQSHKIRTLYLVPPIIILMAKNNLDAYDLSSAKAIFTGAASLGKETASELNQKFPELLIRQGYGLTETCTLACSTPEFDIWPGSSGSLLPHFEARVVGHDGEEITAYGKTGELLLKSPSLVLGYWANEKATNETFVVDENGDRWMRTGDEAMIQKSPKSGHEHIFITDRIKELIKVKGLQVAPAELEAHLLAHPFVADCAVIPIADDMAGEVPKAYVVRSTSAPADTNKATEAICKFVEEHKSRHKWLAGGIAFVDVIPKSPSGKILRRLLRDREKLAAKSSKL